MASPTVNLTAIPPIIAIARTPSAQGTILSVAMTAKVGHLTVLFSPGTILNSIPMTAKVGKLTVHETIAVMMHDLQCTSVQYDAPAFVTMRISDSGGTSWNDGVIQTLGTYGHYKTNVQFRRLGGNSRSRVIELSWAVDAPVSLLGCFVDTIVQGS